MKRTFLILFFTVVSTLYCNAGDTALVKKNFLKLNPLTLFNTYPTYEAGYERVVNKYFGFEVAFGLIQGKPINPIEEELFYLLDKRGRNQRHGFRLLVGPKFYLPTKKKSRLLTQYAFPCITFLQVYDNYRASFELHPDPPGLGVDYESFNVAYRKEFFDLSLRYGIRSNTRIFFDFYIGGGIKLVRKIEDIDVKLKEYHVTYWREGNSPADGSTLGKSYIEANGASFSIPIGIKLGYCF